MVIQALRHLGPEHINEATVEQLRQSLTVRDKAALRREAFSAPGWLIPILQQIAQRRLEEIAPAKKKIA